MKQAVEKKGYLYPTDHDKANVEFKNYKRGNGKCRQPDGVSFGSKDSFYPTGPNDLRPKSIQKKVRTV